MRRQAHHGKASMTRAQGGQQMLNLLYLSRPEAFARLTVGDIVRTCNVTQAAAEAGLAKARTARSQTL